jgi:hypothetical protein
MVKTISSPEETTTNNQSGPPATAAASPTTTTARAKATLDRGSVVGGFLLFVENQIPYKHYQGQQHLDIDKPTTIMHDNQPRRLTNDTYHQQ